MDDNAPLPSRAYNLEIMAAPADRASAQCQGWCFGLPPGIKPEQWPLDPHSGYPLMHGFTLLLPDDYRCHGPDIVAISFYAVALDHTGGGLATNPKIAEVLVGENAMPPADPSLLPFFQSRLASHSRLHRLRDILDQRYAAILLTQIEFDGPLCRPPEVPGIRSVSPSPTPAWLEHGAGYTFFPGLQYAPCGVAEREDTAYYKVFGGMPEMRLEWQRALRWTPRAIDPNAGKAPREDYAEEKTGYQSPYYYSGGIVSAANWRQRDWAKDHERTNIGGTMYPDQAIPPMSPFYVAIDESFGGCNFGTGSAQFDFKDMRFDWAC